MHRAAKITGIFAGNEPGISFIETLVALAILGTIGVTFLSGLTVTTRAAAIVDEQATAESLARSQMEFAQNATYTSNATGYATAPVPDDNDYVNYSATISAQPLHTPDGGIQKITVTISRSGKQVLTLEGYKANR